MLAIGKISDINVFPNAQKVGKVDSWIACLI